MSKQDSRTPPTTPTLLDLATPPELTAEQRADWHNDPLCRCGHSRWEHSIMATVFVDGGCTDCGCDAFVKAGAL